MYYYHVSTVGRLLESNIPRAGLLKCIFTAIDMHPISNYKTAIKFVAFVYHWPNTIATIIS